MCFDLILKNFVQRFLFVYASLRQAALRGLQQTSLLPSKKEVSVVQKPVDAVSDVKAKLCTIKKQKPKQSPILLTIAIYLAPLILALQIIGLGSLLIFSKYTPGFIFLITSLAFLGYISMKIMFHDTVAVRRKMQERREKRKQEWFHYSS